MIRFGWQPNGKEPAALSRPERRSRRSALFESDWPIGPTTVLLVALTLTGCAGNRLYFRPACDDSAQAAGKGELPVAAIPLVDGDGATLGTLCLGSQGVYRLALTPGEKPRRVLHVELLLVNESDAPLRMELSAQRVEALADLPRLTPAELRVDGELAQALVAAPGTSVDADLLFVLADRLDECRIQGFELSWKVASARAAFQGWSAFVPISPAESAYPRQPYRGIWKGYFFPGHAEIPEWGRALFFAPFERPTPGGTGNER